MAKQKISPYVKRREAEYLEWRRKADEDFVEKTIVGILEQARDDIYKDMAVWTTKYAAGNKISISDALKAASEADILDLARKASIYVPNKDFSDLANREMGLYNYSMKMSRNELMVNRIDFTLNMYYGKAYSATKDYLMGLSTAELKRQAGILGVNTLDDWDKYYDITERIATSDFKGVNFSRRIWDNKEELSKRLELGMNEVLMQGKNPETFLHLFRDVLTDEFNGSMYAMKRLAFTEATRVQVTSQIEAYKTAGYGLYGYYAEPDCCPICKELNGKRFDIEKFKLGVNAPPMHPFCRCTTFAAVSAEEEANVEEMRMAGEDARLNEEAKKAKIEEQPKMGPKIDRNDLSPTLQVLYDAIQNSNMTATTRLSAAKSIATDLGINLTGLNFVENSNAGLGIMGSVRSKLSPDWHGNVTINPIEYWLRTPSRSDYEEISTAFHELFHLSASGGRTDRLSGGKINPRFKKIEESMAEVSSYFAMELKGQPQSKFPSYTNYITEVLPKLKKLDEYKNAVTFSDFGKIFWEKRIDTNDTFLLPIADEISRTRLPKNYWKRYQADLEESRDEIKELIQNVPFGPSKEELGRFVDDTINEMLKEMKDEGFAMDNKLSQPRELVIGTLMSLKGVK